MEIKWAKEALNDLNNIHEYMLNEDVNLAFDVVFHIIDKVEVLLPKYKHIGRAGKIFTTRELVLSQYPYIIVYTVKNDCLYIVRVLHTSMKHPQ